MAVVATCFGSLLLRTSWCVPNSVKGLGELGLQQLVSSAHAAKVWSTLLVCVSILVSGQFVDACQLHCSLAGT